MDWGKLFGGLVGGADAAGSADESAEWTVRRVDKFIAELEQASDQDAVQTITAAVPKLDDDSWELFASRLDRRAELSGRVSGLVQYARCVRNALGEVQQLLSYEIPEAFDILLNALPTKSDPEKLAFVGTLAMLAQSDAKARALIGQLRQTMDG